MTEDCGLVNPKNNDECIRESGHNMSVIHWGKFFVDKDGHVVTESWRVEPND
ncbi:MAG: hypothetical protein QQN63_05300 [Nitrosopumilus sp.]